MKKNIVLIGMMGSGKSSVARVLEGLSGWPVMSTDRLIEEQNGRSIPEIFEKDGEAFFRTLEARAVEEAAGHLGIIVDCGGGVVTNRDNIRTLKRTGVVYYLKASPEFLVQTADAAHRPLLADPKARLATLRRLLDERRSHYEQAHRVIVSENRPIDEIAQEIWRWHKNHGFG